MNPITIVGGGIAGLTAAISCAEQGATVQAARSPPGAGRPGADARRPLQGQPRAARDPGPQPVLEVARRARAASPTRAAAAVRRPLPLAGRHPPGPGGRRGGGGAAAAQPHGSGRARLPHLGVRPRRARGGRRPGPQRRDPDLLPRPRRAVGRVPVGGAGPRACCRRRRRRASRSAAGWRSPTRLRRHAIDLGVRIETGTRVSELPEPPVIVATELADARELLGDDSLRWLGGHAVCLDVALRSRRGDPFVVVDLQETGWVERYTAADRSLAPAGEDLLQAQMPIRPGETPASATTAARAAARRLLPRLARARDLAPPAGDERAHRRARSARQDLARPAGDRSRQRRLPGRRHGGRPRLPVGDRLGQRGRGRPAGDGRDTPSGTGPRWHDPRGWRWHVRRRVGLALVRGGNDNTETDCGAGRRAVASMV